MTERRNENQTGPERTIGELLNGKLGIAPFDLFTGWREKGEKSDQVYLCAKTAGCSRMSEDNVLYVLFMIQLSDNQFILYAL